MEENRTGSTAVAAAPSKFHFALAYLCVSARKNFEMRISSHPRCQRRRGTLRQYGRKVTRIVVRQSPRISRKRCGREALRSGDIILFRSGVAGAKSRFFAAEPVAAERAAEKGRVFARADEFAVQTLTPGDCVSLGFTARIVRTAMETIASSRWLSGRCFTSP